MKPILILSFLLSSILSYGSSSFAINHRDEIKDAQAWANTFDRPYPIHIFNRDELQFLFLKNGVTEKTKEDERKRQAIIGEYIYQKIGLILDSNNLSALETQLFITPGSAVALPVVEGYSSGSKYKMCSVFVNSPNGNARIEVERITGLPIKEAYPTETYDELAIKEDFDVMYLFSMYHEVSHCLDQTFMKEMYNSYQPSAHGVHQSESFAETLAYLQLTKRFGKDIAKSRILYRILYSRKIGELFAKNPSLSFGDPLVMAGGGVYFLSPVLVEAYSLVSQKKIKTEELTNDELYLAAINIVQENAVHFRSFSAIVRSLSDAPGTIEAYEKMAFDYPELFLKAYERLVSYLALTDTWLKRSFTGESSDSEPSLEEALEIPTTSLCQALQFEDADSFLDTLDQYREELNQAEASHETRFQRYVQLNEIAQTLSGQCSNQPFLTDNTLAQ